MPLRTMVHAAWCTAACGWTFAPMATRTLQLWTAMQPELVVLDLSLPGLDVLLRARAARCNTPVLILTMCAAMGDRSVGLNVGAEDYLVRPLGAIRIKLTNMLSIFADSLDQASNFQSIVINGCSPVANLIFPACLGKCLETKGLTR